MIKKNDITVHDFAMSASISNKLCNCLRCSTNQGLTMGDFMKKQNLIRFKNTHSVGIRSIEELYDVLSKNRYKPEVDGLYLITQPKKKILPWE